jgi:hypothetical protein
MREKLRELVGRPNVWLYVKSTSSWIRNAQILDVTDKTVTFRYEHEVENEKRFWEKTTRIKNITEVDVKLLTLPKQDDQVAAIKDRLKNLLEQE